ncbi:MAG: hypothetical protein WC759_02775 [Candidatus Micrarchaeia archaeon]|jgi:hypothetical protein
MVKTTIEENMEIIAKAQHELDQLGGRSEKISDFRAFISEAEARIFQRLARMTKPKVGKDGALEERKVEIDGSLLVLAIKYGLVKVAEKLVAAGANPEYVDQNTGKNCIELAQDMVNDAKAGGQLIRSISESRPEWERPTFSELGSKKVERAEAIATLLWVQANAKDVDPGGAKARLMQKRAPRGDSVNKVQSVGLRL